MRVVKPQEPHHLFRALEGDKEIVLVGPERPYLWVGGECGDIYTFSGPKSLRALAKAILKAIP